MKIALITLFPEMFSSLTEYGISGRAVKNGLLECHSFNPRDFTEDRHQTVDARPYGGGPGMVMKPEPMFKAVESVRTENSRVILMCPQGAPFKQVRAQALSKEEHLIFIEELEIRGILHD